MLENSGKWLCAYDGADEWGASSLFDTREQAIKAGRSACQAFNSNQDPEGIDIGDVLDYYPEDDDKVTVFQVGQLEQIMPPISASEILENISEQLYSEHGDDYFENYLTDEVSEAQRDELDKLISDWFVRHNLLPNYYKLVHVEPISVAPMVIVHRTGVNNE